MEKTISVIIPCLNEESNLNDAYRNTSSALSGKYQEYEILIFNDGSTDKTGEIADQIAKLDSHVNVIHNRRNMGFGYNFIEGIKIARMNYVCVIPGDNEISGHSIDQIFSNVGLADIILPYTVNMELRTYSRRFASRLFTFVMNTIFCCDVQYYNGPAVHRLDLVQELGIDVRGFAFQAVMLTKLIRKGHSVCEIPMYLQPKTQYRSTAIKIRSIVSVGLSILKLAFEIYASGRYPRKMKVNRIVLK